MNALLQLIKCGQSYWLDNLTRRKITSGELNKRVVLQGLRGVTSNPAIFDKAISGGDDYDAQLQQLVHAGCEIHEIYERLVVADIQNACDILRPVYDASAGEDGFVSLEVSPYLAHNTLGTMAEARRLWHAVGRPNVCIKIPGTPAGVPAIEAMLYEGININITLLFAIKDYEAVAQAYIRALERRIAEGQPVGHVASVASFFLSRIDVLVDQLLGHRIQPDMTRGEGQRAEQLFGKAAIANAKLAYQSFKRIFRGERWRALVEQGARVQRPLWASTSTKDPLYDDVRYVEPLIGPHTVNTMPDETIDAFADHGVIRENSVEADLEQAHQTLRDLSTMGVDLDQVAWQLQNEGAQKFIDPYDALMQTLAAKRQKFLGAQASEQTMALGAVRSAVTSTYPALDSRRFGRRVFAHDPFLWTSDVEQAEAIRHRVGWLDSLETFRGRVGDIAAFATRIKDAGYTHIVLLGMGSSSLCAEVSRETFGSDPGWPQLLVLDNTDPAAIREVESHLDLARTLFIVSSKSGTTTETLSFYRYFYARVSQHVAGKAGDHFVAITDPGTPLAEEARTQGFRHCFENPADIGGRYSALSYFGLVPMALLGVDIAAILDRGYQMRVSCGPVIPAAANPGISLGALLGMAARHGRDKVTFVFAEPIQAFGAWAEQLLAESTGKEGRGLVPVYGEALDSPHGYSRDRVFVSMQLRGSEAVTTAKQLAALETAGHPIVRISMPDAIAFGGEFFRWELATATAGAILCLNPFDEPDVAESKQRTRDLLSAWQRQGAATHEHPILEADGVTVYGDEKQLQAWRGHVGSMRDLLQAFAGQMKAPEYLALLPYFLRTPARHEALQALRDAFRSRHRVATTLGYGPQYLHSTGQLHKGGPNTGVFIMFTAEASEGIPIPGETYGFATLQRAQALGDFLALTHKQRRVIRLHLGSDVEGGLKRIGESLN
jgi:transaldolase / glucose-6-phosphate isomerase